MRIQPKTEAEIADDNLVMEGEYPFEVITAAETQSKAGNDMLKLWINVVDPEGRNHGVWDYLVSMDSMAYKIRHFSESIGMLPEYERGELLAEALVGCTGKCKIAIQPAKGDFAAKNVVKDYIKRTTPAPAKATVAKSKPPVEDMNDTIPF